MKKIFFRKNTETERKATAGERKVREIRLLDVDRRFGVDFFALMIPLLMLRALEKRGKQEDELTIKANIE